jgi:hypothetical protein
VRVRLTPRLTNPSLGLVAETTPLGSVLLDATVGDTVVLRVPGMAPQPFVIQAIKRSAEGVRGRVLWCACRMGWRRRHQAAVRLRLWVRSP